MKQKIRKKGHNRHVDGNMTAIIVGGVKIEMVAVVVKF